MNRINLQFKPIFTKQRKENRTLPFLHKTKATACATSSDCPICMAVLGTRLYHLIPGTILSSPPYTPAAFSSAMCRHSPSPISKSAGKLLQPALFPSYSGTGKGQALSSAMRCSFFKRHDEYTDRINVYTHHDRSENKR